MTYEEAIEKVHAIMKYCIDVGMNVDVILELNRVIIEALQKQESIKYLMKLNVEYIDKLANTESVNKKQTVKYIKEHLKSTTMSFMDWSDEE